MFKENIIDFISGICLLYSSMNCYYFYCYHIYKGVCGGIAIVVVGHPFDTTKTRFITTIVINIIIINVIIIIMTNIIRLQTAPNGFYNGTIDCCMKTLKWEGILVYFLS